MATANSKTLAEPAGASPDWTYEELIETFVTDYSAGWLEKKSVHAARGIISPYYRQLIVELRDSPVEPPPTHLDIWTFQELHEHRCWLLNKHGLEEIVLAEYQELIADPDFTRTDAFSSMKFFFENEYRFMVTKYFQKLGGWGMYRERIARGEDGKFYLDEQKTLAMN